MTAEVLPPPHHNILLFMLRNNYFTRQHSGRRDTVIFPEILLTDRISRDSYY